MKYYFAIATTIFLFTASVGQRINPKKTSLNTKEKTSYKSPKTLSPKYPVVKENKSLFDNWILQNPIPKKAWVPDIWKKFVAQGGISRLHDFSYAGYHYNEKEIPENQKILGKVTDYGAIPNDNIDDTEAIQKAFDKLSTKKGVILFPKGKFIINSDPLNPLQLHLNANNITIRGEGSDDDGTILHMANKFLPEKGYGDFVFNIGAKKIDKEKIKVDITENGFRGNVKIKVKSAENFYKGQYIKIALYTNKDNGKYTEGLGRALSYPLIPEGGWKNYKKYSPYESVNQIEKIIDNTTIVLKQPLKTDILLHWNPKIFNANFYEEIGIENLQFKSNWKGPYSHHGSREMDYGWCALGIYNVVNGWIKNVNFNNFTWDLRISNSSNITAKNITVLGTDGHHGIKCSSSWNVLVEKINFEAYRTHNIGGSGSMEGCVFKNITIEHPKGAIDFHGGGFPMNNLFENINNIVVSGGGSEANMPHSGRENTFWNIASSNEYDNSSELANEFFPYGFWNYNNQIRKRGNTTTDCYKLYPGSLLIGVKKTIRALEIGNDSSDRDTDFIYIEGLNKPNVWPSSLYDAQFQIRLKNNKKP